MDPWTIIGWFIVIVVSLILGVFAILLGLIAFGSWSLAREAAQAAEKWKEEMPAESRWWSSKEYRSYEVKVKEDGGLYVVSSSGNGSHSFHCGVDRWMKIVTTRRLERRKVPKYGT